MANRPKARKPDKSRVPQTVNSRNVSARFSNYSPLLYEEDEEEFADFRRACVAAVKPENAMEDVWVLDFINYTWEAMRLRRVKVALINASRKKAVEILLWEHGREPEVAKQLAARWSAGDGDAEAELADFLEMHGLEDDVIMATAFSWNILKLEQLEKLIASYDYRRDKAIRELDRRRELLARRAREISDQVTEATYVEVSGETKK